MRGRWVLVCVFGMIFTPESVGNRYYFQRSRREEQWRVELAVSTNLVVRTAHAAWIFLSDPADAVRPACLCVRGVRIARSRL